MWGEPQRPEPVPQLSASCHPVPTPALVPLNTACPRPTAAPSHPAPPPQSVTSLRKFTSPTSGPSRLLDETGSGI